VKYGKHGKHLLHMCLVISTLMLLLSLPAITAKSAEEQTIRQKLKGPYCGLRCLYAAMKLKGKELDFTSLLKPEYLGSKDGSTLGELEKAANDNEMYTVALGNLSTRELRSTDQLMILHVKSDDTSEKFDHYALFLGVRDGQAMILDPPNPVASIPFHQLARLWDGLALVVSDKPIDYKQIIAPAGKAVFALVVIVIVAVIGFRYVRPRIPFFSILLSPEKRAVLSVAQGAGICLLAACVAFIYHFASDEGFLAHQGATSGIVEANKAKFIEKVQASDVRKRIDKDALIVDARYERDYQKNHMDGAVNIAIDSSDDERKERLTGVEKDRPIVVYCQSAGCKYAEIIAGKIISDGFKDVAVYKGGWMDWTKGGNSK